MNTPQSTQKPKLRPLVVSLIGRPNVGKSSIFNRLMGKATKALAYDQPGVTRDRHYGIITLDTIDQGERDLILVDTGGFYPEDNPELLNRKDPSAFFPLMKKHGEFAIEESDLVLFVVDVREGPLPFDQMIGAELRKRHKPFALVVNKYDSDAQMGHEHEFYSLGIDFSEMFVISAAHGRGVGELKSWLAEKAASQSSYFDEFSLQKGIAPREEVAARVALIGAPNAGKSTLLNQLVGSDRALVSDIPGTTVDPIEGYFDLYFGADAKHLKENAFAKRDSMLTTEYSEFRQHHADFKGGAEAELEIEDEELVEIDLPEETINDYSENIYQQVFEESTPSSIPEVEEESSHWRSIHLVDTAGIRRRTHISGTIESQSVFRSLRCISESDVIIYMVDAVKGISHQDRRLLDIALEKGKSVIVTLNKVDLLKEQFSDLKSRKVWIEDLRHKIPWLEFCELIPISAKGGKGLKALKKSLKDTVLRRKMPVPTGELNRLLGELTERHSLMLKKSAGKSFKIKYASQIKGDPPTFLLFTNLNKDIPDNYKRYLKSAIRAKFELKNTPIHLIFRKHGQLREETKV